MSNALPLLGTIALAIAALLTLLVAAMTSLFTMKLPGGPDAMGIVVVFFVQLLAWVLTLGAAFAAVRRGSFDWLTRSGALAALLVLVVVAGLAGLAVAAANASLSPATPARTLVGLSGALLLPLLAQAYLLGLLRSDAASVGASPWTRPVAGLLALAALLACGLGLLEMVRSGRQKARAIEAARQHEDAWQAEQREWRKRKDAEDAAALDALPDDAPLETFVTHLFIDKSDAHQARALARIRKLPDLTSRLQECLSGPEPLQREYCASVIRRSEDPDPAWAPIVGKAITLLAEDYRRDARDRARGKITHVTGLTKGILLAAQRFDVRFEAEARDLKAALRSWPDPDQRKEPIGLVDLYLAGQRISN